MAVIGSVAEAANLGFLILYIAELGFRPGWNGAELWIALRPRYCPQVCHVRLRSLRRLAHGPGQTKRCDDWLLFRNFSAGLMQDMILIVLVFIEQFAFPGSFARHWKR